MALVTQSAAAIPTDTEALARQVCATPTLPMQLRDALGPIYSDVQFAHLFAQDGRPAEAPATLALVSVFQFLDNLSDRQAADCVRVRIDWKYAFGLPLDDTGFCHTVLTDFRERLITGSAELQLLSTLLELCRANGWLDTRRQRTDATHVLAAIRCCNRSELVGETLRAALNALALAAPGWLASLVPVEWYERYAHRFETSLHPQTPTSRTTLLQTTAEDGAVLLAALFAPTAPPFVRSIEAVEVLRTVWLQQFVSVDGKLRPRTDDELPPASRRIVSPYDTQARTGVKRHTLWDGYKVHLTETVTATGPQLITQVETTPASDYDGAALPHIQQALAAADLLPHEHLLDAGYLSVDQLLASRAKHAVEVVGPLPADTSWQAREQTGFDVSSFSIDWEQQVARCPQGEGSTRWYERTNHRSGDTEVLITFAPAACGSCAMRERCTTAAAGRPRTLTLRPQAEHTALQEARARQKTQAFKELYAKRAGIEGTLSQGIRAGGLRRSRYRGLAKTHLQHILVAVALNVTRLLAWLAGEPRTTSRCSAFAALNPSRRAVPSLP